MERQEAPTVTLTTPATPAAPLERRRLLRWGYLVLGCLMVALGLIGAMLPVMPTTIFLILALACFSRASPRLEQKLLDHPRFGPSLRLWRQHGAMSRRAKHYACGGIALGFVLMCAGRPPWWVIVMVGAFEIGLVVYLVRRPELPDGL